MKISVVIPVYKNTDLFLSHLAVNHSFFKDCEVIVVDDASGENIIDKIHEAYPNIIVTENTHNLGFSKTVNEGIKEAKGDLILLLNSDVRLFDNSFTKSVDEFSDKLLFAVSFAQKEKDRSIVGKNKIYFENGFIHHKKAENLEKGLNAWAEGGSCIIRREYFDSLGGFDELYSPFYWEDIDLSYRAYKRGWKILFDPSIIVEHYHESTIGKYYDKSQIKTIAYRNQFIFQWKNITEGKMWRQHVLSLHAYIARAVLKGDKPFIRSFFSALSKFGAILSKRGVEVREGKLKDSQILQLIK